MLTRDQKVNLLDEFGKKAEKSRAILLVDFTGLKVGEVKELRRTLKGIGIEFKVLKKTLVQRILKVAGIVNFNIFQFPSSTALVLSPEEGLDASKAIYDFSKKNKTFKILGGFIDKSFISSEMIVNLAKLPSREVLLSQLVYVLNSLPRALVGVLNGNLLKLVIAIDQIAKKK
jgi:large subunit ribosomal protein L10